jgi:transcriptional regulator with XRE-family HTH domain
MPEPNPLEIVRSLLKGRTQTEVAEKLGISQSYLSDLLHGKREPGPKVLEALKVRKVVGWEWDGGEKL